MPCRAPEPSAAVELPRVLDRVLDQLGLAFQSQALAPALEGQDLVLTGSVAGLPQWLPGGLRFRFAVDGATRDGVPVALPPLIDLGWWTDNGGGGGGAGGGDGSPAPIDTSVLPNLPDLRAGERWRFTARLKAPHGARNPHGFDYELWAWGQGFQAIGSVRQARRAEAPRRLAPAGAAYPVEQARQRVRDAILQRLEQAPGSAGAAA